MEENNNIQLFENKRIRTAWDEEAQEWYFSVVDVIDVLTDSREPRRYWSDLKIKLKNEGNETYDNIVQLKMTAEDGKRRKTDVADTEQLLRIIQSIPSPKAEPFKMWLALVGRERIDETIDPEIAIDRALITYL
ncbi:Bro-N domain-containing protein, partial [Candidatus Saccharibacteria bacterium]|nr:Bro-N domain-containing protein [Candidatus Saccharibacteria bacterium]